MYFKAIDKESSIKTARFVAIEEVPERLSQPDFSVQDEVRGLPFRWSEAMPFTRPGGRCYESGFISPRYSST